MEVEESLFWVGGGRWEIIWLSGGGLFWVGGGRWENILRGCG